MWTNSEWGASAIARGVHQAMSGVGTAKTILCVEDEHRLRQDIVDELAIAGYNALGAADGREALTLLDARRPDLILCDISMPRLEGLGFLETMRDTRPDLADVPLVFLTALGGRDHIIICGTTRLARAFFRRLMTRVRCGHMFGLSARLSDRWP